MSDLGRIVRESGIAEAIVPRDDMRQRQALRQVVDETGAIVNKAARPFRTPQAMHWFGASGRQRVMRAGVVTVVAAHANTAPSTGSGAVVTFTQETELGSNTIATLNIPVGTRIVDSQVNFPVLAGAWINASVTTVAGSANVSISLVIKVD